MKKSGVFIIVLLLIFFETMAQQNKKFWIGPQVGINGTKLIKDAGKSHPLVNVAAGIAFEYRISPRFTASSELAFTTLGESIQASDQTTIFRIKTTYKALLMPVMLKYRPKTSLFFGEAGGQIGYILNRNIKSDTQTYKGGEYNNVDFGLTIGGGRYFGKHICVDLRYYQGVTPINKNGTYTDPTSGQVFFFKAAKVVHQLLGIHLFYYL